ncbi:MAG: hypothetical protein B6D72_10230 [gamma proteobacterium symbiont of Ctena orbiculata]|uniref:Uncharacterized protein n=1 Tax=Candidatus Thiodiazotropha taylori TaxID=2792791 RepID=A0A944QV38_9GAMM|nr:hypothetical protein [Candidatus Thiodiazotropha taylori]PUB89664.1 MAG: hypothetical protein DBP00_01915 [gamma proteobacterium symbiont of Ctena orbiculata]MBT2990812.1 hypothetical protein [Candidatus Thiodiazotropha taylori]MBT2997762.1 hypothetical protein [Candidatus Thiodiazotropha taylori]MBT3000469.1 hypothetical protein [Candidatus Thiodiazotropha taylori]
MDNSNCTLCRMMRGLAFGGIGAAIGGYGSLLLGAERSEAVYYALFGALAMTVILQRKRGNRDSGDE